MTLSDKEIKMDSYWEGKTTKARYFRKEDVKEFIKELKKNICQQPMMDCGSFECGICHNCEMIKQLAGEKLI